MAQITSAKPSWQDSPKTHPHPPLGIPHFPRSLPSKTTINSQSPLSEDVYGTGLDAHAQLQRELTVLRARAKKEKQINRRVELNLRIKKLETELAAVAKTL